VNTIRQTQARCLALEVDPLLPVTYDNIMSGRELIADHCSDINEGRNCFLTDQATYDADEWYSRL
jgi:hypothetical protein